MRVCAGGCARSCDVLQRREYMRMGVARALVMQRRVRMRVGVAPTLVMICDLVLMVGDGGERRGESGEWESGRLWQTLANASAGYLRIWHTLDECRDVSESF